MIQSASLERLEQPDLVLGRPDVALLEEVALDLVLGPLHLLVAELLPNLDLGLGKRHHPSLAAVFDQADNRESTIKGYCSVLNAVERAVASLTARRRALRQQERRKEARAWRRVRGSRFKKIHKRGRWANCIFSGQPLGKRV